MLPPAPLPCPLSLFLSFYGSSPLTAVVSHQRNLVTDFESLRACEPVDWAGEDPTHSDHEERGGKGEVCWLDSSQTISCSPRSKPQPRMLPPTGARQLARATLDQQGECSSGSRGYAVAGKHYRALSLPPT
ncbi:hypothetical protein GUITHDRAFT_148935 [Guillardia theta CCMP2712]|uniref:Uncharacterized protein n=1 Tax=Guillardia theta (strain CCMP2712) TaxID=905079 RepID=L1I808_GUITC|nr:hypothetical protein GUITHDRAFT_148935 [Guillardia theta CCMP2712]EKX31995.1 hypothetical protein GUITHDRAFT_148935 [Guillardia theta CCMP2712]|eukprot:XP_005818975.1 hypothetical protein GUITHDRAFT_148935 [Guillardia theta CCMP2712]